MGTTLQERIAKWSDEILGKNPYPLIATHQNVDLYDGWKPDRTKSFAYEVVELNWIPTLFGLSSEIGELVEAIETANVQDIQDAIADIIIFSLDLLHRLDLDWEDCEVVNHHPLYYIHLNMGKVQNAAISHLQNRKGFGDETKFKQTVQKGILKVIQLAVKLGEENGFNAWEVTVNTFDNIVGKRTKENWEELAHESNPNESVTFENAEVPKVVTTSTRSVTAGEAKKAVSEILADQPSSLERKIVKEFEFSDIDIALKRGWRWNIKDGKTRILEPGPDLNIKLPENVDYWRFPSSLLSHEYFEDPRTVGLVPSCLNEVS